MADEPIQKHRNEGGEPVLEVAYEGPEHFTQDYHANLASGGVFVETALSYEARSIVCVRLRLDWCRREIDLRGEVVHIVPAETIEVGGRPGMAVQFLDSPAAVRDLLAPLCVDSDASQPELSDEGRRAPRKRVRVDARVDSEAGSLWGRTRNLSRSGVLISVQEGAIPVGARVRVVMRHPTRDDELPVAGTVVRIVEEEGQLSALAVHFDPELADRASVDAFVEEVQGLEHTRHLGGISGPIQELGPQSIVQMFATSSPKGTITLRNGEEEAVLCFENGVLTVARVGNVSGMKALVRMLTWVEGSFEFHTAVEPPTGGEEPISVEAAVFDAMRQIDEGARLDRSHFPLQARLVASDAAADNSGEHSKVEAALIDLARAGFTVQRALEVIPEPDPEILRALQTLIDLGTLELR